MWCIAADRQETMLAAGCEDGRVKMGRLNPASTVDVPYRPAMHDLIVPQGIGGPFCELDPSHGAYMYL